MIESPADLRRVTGADFTVSEQQWKAISADLEPGVVIAGAGSGKTELMSARVIYLVANKLVTPDQVLGLTFTTKATAELGARVRTALAKAGLDEVASEESVEKAEPTVLTYNSYGAGLLADHGLRIGHEADLRVMADAARFQLAQRVIAGHQGVVELLSDHPATVIKYLLALDAAMSEHLVGVEEVRSFHEQERPMFEASLARLIAEGGRTKGKQDSLKKVLQVMSQRDELLGLVAEYRAAKAELGLIDFSDQIAGAHRLATEHPEVGAAERERFKVVLLDEYQDTSVAQARLLAGLFAGEDAAGHAVMAVGDPNQAIYGWRGASVANIAQFPEHFPRSDGSPARRFNLTVNRRSDADILAAANRLAQPLYDDPSMPVQRLEAKPDAKHGVVRAVRHRTDTEELEWVAQQIHATHDAGTAWREIGVLVRTNKHAAQAYDVLSAAKVPVEIVGLGGLIRLPEVAQVVATLSLLDDLTDNAALLTLLTGPRWEIGVRDLALLGRRAGELIGSQGRDEAQRSLVEQLQESVAGADPTEVASLVEALDNPGDLPYSPQARARFAALAAELRHLRGFTGEPLLDLLRRIMDVIGLDIELASSTSEAAAARRDNLDLFVKAVAEFQAVDGSVTLGALNAWLDIEDEEGGGLDLAAPSESDAVKLLTIHRAKGLEYDSVFLIGVGAKKFPNDTLRSRWTSVCSVLPSPLRGDRTHVPQLRGYLAEDLGAFDDETREHQAEEELRLGYVAWTRARHEFVVSSHAWAPSPVKEIAPSAYQLCVVEHLREQGREPEVWHTVEPGEVNPHQDEPVQHPWPGDPTNPERTAREVAAALVRAEAEHVGVEAEFDEADAELSSQEQQQVATWDAEIDRLLAEAAESAADVVEVPLPSSLSATGLARLRLDPEAFAREIARPVPRRPVPQARFGTRFHAWVETRYGQQQLLDPDELSGRGDAGIEDDSDLRELQQRFEAGQFAERVPFAVEPPFSLTLAGQVIRGRIDAVFAEADGGFLIIDWKTNKALDADPVQLAIYRQAWAELQGVDPTMVRAAFYYVRHDHLEVIDDLPDRTDLEQIFTAAVAGQALVPPAGS